MILFKGTCVSKNRDTKGNVKSYNLRSEMGIIEVATSKQIKDGIRSGQYIIDNLQIDKAGRLVDKKAEPKKLGFEKSVDLLKFMEKSLINGKAVTIPKLESNKVFGADEIHSYVPKYLIKPMMNVLENAPTGVAIRNLCESLVPMAVKNVENKGYRIEASVIQCRGTSIEIYEVSK